MRSIGILDLPIYISINFSYLLWNFFLIIQKYLNFFSPFLTVFNFVFILQSVG